MVIDFVFIVLLVLGVIFLAGTKEITMLSMFTQKLTNTLKALMKTIQKKYQKNLIF